ncbi:MAG: DNA repair protein RecO [Candidatus Doudnabacteria bacterium RIFCSPLOWO2_02_FULL_42_9]|uniref:DNA repair protein RecO n=1 Tax=Candidatus Doudnabacteria bacterium RIFCSPHIGHO2_01_FULL_41_86 TaxID=1817821 RepID=A0A1F5N7Y9_9BACT|nr:MAG: DNA repair protein RecO [Candidatus Doudnabacteria bacterium RIFCSPHIGHO2_01_FULL_41_86]OGE74910.1 MAG: DNA repair protein RecO [Candidatus Doudnabacteria bacterium RIFCSPHIGHO2_01_43_10]OGE85803.1 MAG: DNA repair protein RecO [Candidatus Doudnabacteria bacterium RIFCSPHIGHO2_12_FULL_42_22]OGE87298.1 MAG: DNA repair protein RecO [Candidatus Doudnabacteria bacterium RIFCSPHIGHO2_02_FULL_42_25]OGE92135.1 MAG: DNA repair protein RecO [Candidatus Doudnabacteria bacterium RIFCSPLOWO2_01_FULL
MKYRKHTGVILKKQNYKEADQILTLWTKDLGKVRILAKSIRLPKSKLAFALQDLSLCEVDVAGGNFPVLIGAKPVKQYNSIHQDLQKMAIGLYGAELMLKMTADEHPNSVAFDLLIDFLHNLNHPDYYPADYKILDKFSLDLLDTLGFRFPEEKEVDHTTINKFIEYILERPVWTTKF